MKTIDIHTHLLSSDVVFQRSYDKLALRFFAKKFGMDPKALVRDPYGEYTRALVSSVRNSQHIEKIVLFGVDDRVDDAGKSLHKDITVCATNEDVATLYRGNEDVIIPFFSINPNRPDALDLIDRYADAGFRGAKFLQNYWGVDTREERYRPYFDKLAARGLPLIVHVGSESSVHSFKSCESIEMLDHPLEAGVQVICAHMALSYEPRRIFQALSKNPKNFNDEYYILLEMLKEHDNLYADISALLTPVRAKVLRHLSRQSDIHHKLLFGTDFPVPFSTVFNSYDLPYRKRFELSREANPFDRYSKAILEYFPAENPIYTNYTKILGTEA
ncbi:MULTISPECIES: amidohydrolase family protein [unclassified Sulfuricurvum]|uniref:amidohydrolase family protein n=1 Tax=unclassified Sulfuricurvum TaxID=2632390 RepID=UPI0002998022|nr:MULTISPECIES: amidohydrolase family protein [unclassified Sulfuricurvum]AFV98605.1 putative mannonate dehydratase [Candidatus Sulfuricurvum sp. RIFRC-1]HBM36926.1 amidohydrolase [Sulfuricurvum sp.]